MTNTWADIKNTDLVVIMGGNAAEAHPCGFKWVTEAKAHNKAKLIVVDPRFTRSAAVADLYVPIRAGTDIAWLGGLINYLLTQDKIQHEYVKAYTNATFIVKPGFGFSDGLFTGYDAQKRDYDRSSWGYEIGEDGYAKLDETLQDARCVFQLMKAHYARYTPEMVERICGSPKDKLIQAWEWIAETSALDRAMTSMYALGWTQHSKGSEHPDHGDGPAAARQYRRRRRRHECAARSFQYSRPDRSRADEQSDPRVHDLAVREGGEQGDLSPEPGFQAAAARTAQLLAELPQILCQLLEVHVRQGSDRGQRFRLQLAAKTRCLLRRAADLRADAPGEDQRLFLPGVQPADGVPQQEEADQRFAPAQIPRGHGPAGHRDRQLLGEPLAVQ